MGLYWVPGHAGVRGIEIADKIARDGSVQNFVVPEPFLWVSMQNDGRKIKTLDGKAAFGIVVWSV